MKVDVVMRWAGLPTDRKAVRCRMLGFNPTAVFPVYSDDLKYCMRGVCRYMRWFHKVFLLLDDDEALPPWLEEGCERLVIVRHSAFIPNEFLPTYNSHVIDSWIHRVPGLSERFVVFDDEMFVVKPVREATFYHRDGRPITRHYEGRDRHKMTRSRIAFAVMWQDAIRKWGLKYTRIQHHGMPFLKSVMARYERDVFGEALKKSGKMRTRGRGDVNLLRFSSALMSERRDGHMVRTSDAYDLFIEGPELTEEQANDIVRGTTRPVFLCINNTHPNQACVYKLLRRLFPRKCEFEKATKNLRHT